MGLIVAFTLWVYVGMRVCDCEAQDKSYLIHRNRVLLQVTKSGTWDTYIEADKPSEAHTDALPSPPFFFCLCFSFFHYPTRLPLSLTSLLLPFPEGPSLKPQREGEELGMARTRW